MTLLLPAAFFAALDGRTGLPTSETVESFLNDDNRTKFLQMSRGLAVILLTVLVVNSCGLYLDIYTCILDTSALGFSFTTRLAQATLSWHNTDSLRKL
jgi:hypothetical protein